MIRDMMRVYLRDVRTPNPRWREMRAAIRAPAWTCTGAALGGALPPGIMSTRTST